MFLLIKKTIREIKRYGYEGKRINMTKTPNVNRVCKQIGSIINCDWNQEGYPFVLKKF
jgi:hypothetical protein